MTSSPVKHVITNAYAAVAGVRIPTTQNLGPREILIFAVSLGIDLGVTTAPEILKYAAPPEIKSVFSSGMIAGGLTAILLSIILPHCPPSTDEDKEVERKRQESQAGAISV